MDHLDYLTIFMANNVTKINMDSNRSLAQTLTLTPELVRAHSEEGNNFMCTVFTLILYVSLVDLEGLV